MSHICSDDTILCAFAFGCCDSVTQSNCVQELITTWQLYDCVMQQHKHHLLYDLEVMYGNRWWENIQLLLWVCFYEPKHNKTDCAHKFLYLFI